MLIILEGPDGSGKSTLAQQIAEHLGRTTSDKIEIWHAREPDRHPLDEYLRPLRGYRPGTGHHLILDRWHWGEVVYPRVRERETQLDPPTFWAIEAYLRRLGALVVHCDRRATSDYLDVYRERGLNRPGHASEWQLTHLSRIRLEFERMIYRSQLPTWSYRVDDDIVTGIVESARHYEASYRDLNEFTTYLGGRTPHTLLVGDVRNGRDPATTSDPSPAFVPTRDTSGHYLLKSLNAQSHRGWFQTLGLANACDVDDVFSLWTTLNRPFVVALGRNAQRELAKIGDIPHGVVPHPQYVRRFHCQLYAEYGAAIYEASTHPGRDYSKWPQSSTSVISKTDTSSSSTPSDSTA